MVLRVVLFLITIWLKLFYHHKIYGLEHLNEHGGLMAANHCSFLDPPILGASCPYIVHVFGRDTLFRNPIFGWLLGQLNTHPIARGKENLGPIKLACSLLKNDKKLLIFPEGKRSLDGQFLKGEHGVGFLVQRTGCLVFPVYVGGTFDIWDAKRRFPKLKGQTACVFGSPLDLTHISEPTKKETQAKIADEIMLAIARLRDWYLAGAQGSPP